MLRADLLAGGVADLPARLAVLLHDPGQRRRSWAACSSRFAGEAPSRRLMASAYPLLVWPWASITKAISAGSKGGCSSWISERLARPAISAALVDHCWRLLEAVIAPPAISQGGVASSNLVVRSRPAPASGTESNPCESPQILGAFVVFEVTSRCVVGRLRDR